MIYLTDILGGKHYLFTIFVNKDFILNDYVHCVKVILTSTCMIYEYIKNINVIFNVNKWKPISYLNWAPGEPNNAGDEDCAHVSEPSTYQWNDEGCDWNFSYICQRPKG